MAKTVADVLVRAGPAVGQVGVRPILRERRILYVLVRASVH